MIRHIRGTVLSVSEDSAVIEVAGFGVQIALPAADGLTVGTEASLDTYLSVTQNGLELYGFTSEADRRFFELALCVPGVGPKTALSLLRRAPRAQLESAIGKRDVQYLTRVVGLGKKAAEKLVVELAEKIGTGGAHGDQDAEVFDTLVALGYTEREARRTVGAIPSDVVGKDARLKAALSLAR
jgi:Holliday junction DNA helicase RuvA